MCKKCRQYKRHIEELEAELALIKFELDNLRAKRYKSKHKNPPKDVLPKVAPKKKGGLFGHIGWFRRKPKRPDKVEEVRLDKCPECGSFDISECEDIEKHTQEDIILPKVEVTVFFKHKYYCKNCRTVVIGRGKTELPKSYIGPKAKALAVFLKYAVKISERDIKNIFSKLFGMEIVPSSIAGFRQQLKRQAEPSLCKSVVRIFSILLNSKGLELFLNVNSSIKDTWIPTLTH